MATIENKIVTLSDDEKFIAYQNEKNVAYREFTLPLSENGIDFTLFDFFLDISYNNGSTDIVALIKSVGSENIVLNWDITATNTLSQGALKAQLRGTNGIAQIWKSGWISFTVGASINSSEAQPETLPTAFAQFEQAIVGYKNDTEGFRDEAEHSAQQAEQAYANSVSLLNSKQDKQDNNLDTTDKTITGAINEVNAKTNTALTEAATAQSNIGNLEGLDLQEQDKSDLVTAINAVQNNIGAIAGTVATNIVAEVEVNAALALEKATAALNQSKNLVGELNELKTAEQNTVVGAVNEVYDRAEAKQDKAFITCTAPFAITEPKIVIVAKTGSFAENEIKAYNITCNDTELANAWKQMSCKIGVAENTTSSVNQQVKIWLHSQKVKINNFSSVFGISSVVVGDIIYGWYGGYPSLTAISFCKNSLPIGVEFGDPYFKVGVVTGNNEMLLLPQDGSKVDKINGKGLSTNDYTTAEKSKLAGINIPTPLKTTISTPVFQNQPTYSGVLSNYFKTGEQEFYYTVRKNTLYNDGWFRLQKACGNSSTTIAFDFQLGTGGTAYQTGSGYLSEGTAVDFINDNGIWKMRPRFLSSYVDIVLPIGLQKSDFTISISGQAQTPSNISILLLPFNTTSYNFVGTVAKYDGTSGFIFGYAGLPVKKFVFNEFNATVKRFKKTIHIDGVRSLASGDTFEAPYNVYREVSAGFAYDTTGGDITANISTVRISTVKLANYTEIILKEVV